MKKLLILSLLLASTLSVFGQEKEVKKGWSLGLLPTATMRVSHLLILSVTTDDILSSIESVLSLFASISDLILSGTYFGEGKDRPVDVITNHAAYYIAQFIIATSIAFIA